jgi:hypothetical protein
MQNMRNGGRGEGRSTDLPSEGINGIRTTVSNSLQFIVISATSHATAIINDEWRRQMTTAVGYGTKLSRPLG